MKILILEDDNKKYEGIVSCVKSLCPDEFGVIRATHYSDGVGKIYQKKFDLIIADLMMPQRAGEQPTDITDDFMAALEQSEKNRGVNVLVLTAYEELVADVIQRFNEAGVVVVHYQQDSSKWQQALEFALQKVTNSSVFDFIIFCALEIERRAYQHTSAKHGELRNIRGLDASPMQIGDLKGVCIKLPRMGLVEACVTAARAIEKFNPKIVAMSGICAGIAANSEIGTLVIADPCWEYQAGKWAKNQFKTEHYETPMDPLVRTEISQIIAEDEHGDKIKKSVAGGPAGNQKIVIAPMSTGSAVVASAERVDAIKEQNNRKMAGIEMEMYGIYRAAQASTSRPIFFGAKTVVDLADDAKGDQYHEYGCILSAKFVVLALPKLIPLAAS
jgi:adenosylhomocysteine nucleosidase